MKQVKPFQAVKLLSGTGDSIMHVIMGKENVIYITQEEVNKEGTIERISPKDETNRWIYDHFMGTEGELVEDILPILNRIKNSSHDWWTLMLIDCLVNDMIK